jgi:molybdopterin biosynthesis enzyme
MGQSDFIPETIKNEHYHIHFHGVRQRPGKPFLFATKADCAVFGFPRKPCIGKRLRQLLFKGMDASGTIG